MLESQGLFHELAAAGAVVAFVEGIHLLQTGRGESTGRIFVSNLYLPYFFFILSLTPAVTPAKMACHREILVFLTPIRDPKAAKPTPENGEIDAWQKSGHARLCRAK